MKNKEEMMPKTAKINEKIFKAYDIRGLYPEEINEEAAYNIAKAYATWLKPKKVALGRDVRISSKPLFEEAKRGLVEMGVDVVDVGLITSDMIFSEFSPYVSSSVMMAMSVSSAATLPISGLLPRSLSPVAPNTLISLPLLNLRSSV